MSPFHATLRRVILDDMKLLARLLSVIAVIGLLVFPISAVAAGNAMAVAEQAQAQAMSDMGDMPCCPGIKPMKPDCGKDCPLVVICTTSTAVHLAKADWSPAAIHWSSMDFRPLASSALASLAAEPPARPPKA